MSILEFDEIEQFQAQIDVDFFFQKE